MGLKNNNFLCWGIALFREELEKYRATSMNKKM